tara:strand:+ start:223 stop:672 length:450 start_codon:yes stop_codon:yes gene_type:complete
MKKSELKKILKPLVQECIKESLLEDGLISGIITEVVKGMNSPPTIVEVAPPTPDPIKSRMQRNAFNKDQTNKLYEHKKKLRAAIGGGAYNGVDLFEGTTPAPAQGTPSSHQGAPLSGHAPSDAGVDISNLFGAVGSSWNAHMNDVGEGK